MEVKDLKTEALHDVYKELAQLIGFENMQKLFEYFRGQQLNFPSRIYDQRYIREVLREQYDEKKSMSKPFKMFQRVSGRLPILLRWSTKE